MVPLLIFTALFLSTSASDTCVQKFFECIMTDSLMDEFTKTEIKCCKKVINDEKDAWVKNFQSCFEEDHLETYITCIDDFGEGCEEHLLKYMNEATSAYEKFDKEIMEKLERPETEEKCDDSFVQNIEEVTMEHCKENKLDELEDMCEVVINYYSSRDKR
ncbi:uncharacterized protein [Centruroides vittatus]|uniref:uncharacterized protein isoform X2 n=1 Tax=Centruroides vittatus TaxID=120091 RepID=UPI00350EABA2